MDLFESRSYKDAILERLKELKRRGRRVNLRMLAEAIKVQYTYLSKVLHHEKAQLNEDQIWSIGECLELHEAEIEFLLLLRTRDTCLKEGRKKHLNAKIAAIQKAKDLKAKPSEVERAQLDREMRYLFQPENLLVYISLHVPELRKNLSKLRFVSGLSERSFKDALHQLSDLGMIEMDETKTRVLRLKRAHTHYGLQHPLMRVHQSLMRAACLARIPQTEEQHRQNFMVSFASDQVSFDRIQIEMKSFIQKVEKIVMDSSPNGTYQLNLDLFKWW